MADRGSGARSSAATAAYELRHVLRRSLTAYPSFYLPIVRRKYPGSVVDDETELVIDGFTRSAVTFAVVAFQLAQNGHVRVAHHLHASSHLVAAARLGVPALVPVRPPEDTILSALVREPLVTPRQFLKSYIAFYERLLPYRPRFSVATFDAVTTDLGAVIRRTNEQFGTDFKPFEHTEENVRACFELIDERASAPPWEDVIGAFLSGRIALDEYREATKRYREGASSVTVPVNRVARPSEERRALRVRQVARYGAPGLAALRERAERAFTRFLATP